MQLSRSGVQKITHRLAGRPSLQAKRISSYGFPRQLHSSVSITTPPLLSSKQNTSSQWLQRRFNSSNVQSFADPNRPDLFYHIVQPPTPVSKALPAYALCLLPEKPCSSLSATIIGWLPTQGTTTGTTPVDLASGVPNEMHATLTDFISNSAFVDVLHSAIKDGLREGVDEIQKATAMQTIHGWMHINDQRNIPALNRIGEPDDIIGTVLVEDSEIIAETYQPMPAYRLVTSDGPMQLTPGLAQKLQSVLARIAEAEKASLL